MSIDSTLERIATALERIADKKENVVQAVDASPVEESKPVKKRAKRKPAKKKEEVKDDMSDDLDDLLGDSAEPEKAEEGDRVVTKDELMTFLQSAIKKGGVEVKVKVSEIFAEYGAKVLSDIPEDKYAEIYDKVEEATA